MPNDFTSVLTQTISNEGTVPDTSGVGNRGNSLLGITQKSWDDYTKRMGLNSSRVEDIKPVQVASFYKDYFKKTGIENLPPDLYRQVFDYSVQSGPPRAIKDLQELVGVKPDGIIGPKTLEAISKYSTQSNELQIDYLNKRMKFLEKLAKDNPNTHGKLLNGYRNRIDRMSQLIPEEQNVQ
jgi:lysozyme family protein